MPTKSKSPYFFIGAAASTICRSDAAPTFLKEAARAMVLANQRNYHLDAIGKKYIAFTYGGQYEFVERKRK